jgi:hypothetical protein
MSRAESEMTGITFVTYLDTGRQVWDAMLKEVTKDEFYGIIYSKNLDVHPRAERDASYWEFPNRNLFGKSTPGYMGVGPKAYFLATP